MDTANDDSKWQWPNDKATDNDQRQQCTNDIKANGQ
jgi:hypothetical protein